MEQSHALTPGTLLAGRYEIVALLGRGGMSAVYRARDLRLPTAVWAIKEMGGEPTSHEEQQEARQLFEREALLLAGLAHSGLPHVSDYFTENDRQYLVMELIEGQTLDNVVTERGYIEVTQALRWTLQICDALIYLHERPEPIVFRDVKPQNIMITKSGAVRIIDFGIARIHAAGKADDTIALGTPGYAAPEQYGSRGQTDARADVYGLGATLHYMLTGRDPSDRPFRFTEPSSIRPDIPTVLDQIVLRAVAVDLADRFPSMREMALALEGVLAAATSAPITVPVPGQTPGATPSPQPGVAPTPPAPALVASQTAHTEMLTTPTFEVRSLEFGRMRRGETRRLNVRIVGDVDGLLVSDSRKWLRVEPHRVRGRDPVAQLIVYSGGLREGREHHALVTLRTRGGQDALPVRVEIEPARLSLAGVVLAALLTAATLIPAIGLVAAGFLLIQYATCPLDERPALRPFLVATGLFAFCNAAFITVTVVLFRAVPQWANWIRNWLPY